MKRFQFKIIVPLLVFLIFVIITLVTTNKNTKINMATQYNNDLVVQHSYLLKIKLALVEYIRLTEKDPDYDTLKGQVENRFNTSFKEGSENIESLISQYPESELLRKTQYLYQEPDGIMQKEDDIIINYLVDLTNLLQEYQFQIQESRRQE